MVIGAGSGIGAATARQLAAEGARVCVADINLAAAQSVAESIAAAGGEAFAEFIDIAEEAAVNAAVAAAVETLGGLDGAHINAADLRVIFEDTDLLAEDVAVFDRTLQVNVRGHFLCTRAVLPALLQRGAGSIVYTSSGAADAGDSSRPAYAVAKSGLNALMRHVASRWGREGDYRELRGARVCLHARNGGRRPGAAVNARRLSWLHACNALGQGGGYCGRCGAPFVGSGALD